MLVQKTAGGQVASTAGRRGVMKAVFFLVITAVLLSACRIEIAVPEGGMVEGYTLYGCGEREVCTIEVDHLWFLETFQAVADANHRFLGWKQGDRYLCSGSTAPCSLSTFDLAGSTLETLLYDDGTRFFLEPVFEPRYAAYERRLDPQLLIRVHYRQRNYPVDGTSHSSWTADVQSDANPITARGPEGQKYMGQFFPESAGHFDHSFDDGWCRLTRYEKDYTNTITLPAPYFPAGSASDEADEYYWDIVFHEGAHAALHRLLLERRRELINELFTPFNSFGISGEDGCRAALANKLQEINASTYRQYSAETDEFHALDDGGDWGECEPPNRFMNVYCPPGMQ